MIAAGCDVGSLTAKAVIMDDGFIISSKIIRDRKTPLESARAVMSEALSEAGLSFKSINYCCSTGYGRHSIPFALMNMSEISCHALGAFWAEKSVRTVIDIGGQDCKVISLDDCGMVSDFIMNDKCAAGTGRSLEILSRSIGLPLEKLGPVSLKSWKGIPITNKCSIFMELEVLQHLYKGKRTADIARGINEAVARRVVSLARSIEIKEAAAITGGVSKNIGVVKKLERLLGLRFTPLSVDPQIIGALGAAVFAANELKKAGNAEVAV
ncbi:MAG TPA: acyl-CoA dehydratase activase [Spirochaetota bacterium]|nr:acyl-CoA dehydratase activase [Spirochaetota bacterium]HPI88501.1 acyl-CoA dehydratase activase [Spirochaetota bacterium]HPR47981.1 acyl-CoA dehydratase activase [Spirochaetota bacterium]